MITKDRKTTKESNSRFTNLLGMSFPRSLLT